MSSIYSRVCECIPFEQEMIGVVFEMRCLSEARAAPVDCTGIVCTMKSTSFRHSSGLLDALILCGKMMLEKYCGLMCFSLMDLTISGLLASNVIS